MRCAAGVIVVVGIVVGAACVEAKDKRLEELPKDLWNLATLWTEPIKHVAKETRRFDPVSGLWFGILEGSVKSVERTSDFFLPKDKETSGPDYKGGKAILRYTF